MFYKITVIFFCQLSPYNLYSFAHSYLQNFLFNFWPRVKNNFTQLSCCYKTFHGTRLRKIEKNWRKKDIIVNSVYKVSQLWTWEDNHKVLPREYQTHHHRWNTYSFHHLFPSAKLVLGNGPNNAEWIDSCSPLMETFSAYYYPWPSSCGCGCAFDFYRASQPTLKIFEEIKSSPSSLSGHLQNGLP